MKPELVIAGGVLGFLGMTIGYNHFPVLQIIPVEYYSVLTLIVTFVSAILVRVFFAVAVFVVMMGVVGGFVLFLAPKVIQWFSVVSVAETLDIIKNTPRTYPIDHIEAQKRDKMIKNMKEYKEE